MNKVMMVAGLVVSLIVFGIRAESVVASKANDLVANTGVNVHWSYDYYAADKALLLQKLGQLGVGFVRDGTTAEAFSAAPELWNTHKIKTLFLTGNRFPGPWPQRLDTSKISAEMASIKAMPAGSIMGIEAPNEYDISRPSSDADWVNLLKGYSRSVYKKAKADNILKNIPIVGPSFTSEGAYISAGNYDSIIDGACIHLYQSNRHPGTGGWGDNGYGSIAWGLTYNAYRQSSSHKPVWSTECGYRMSGNQSVNEKFYAKYTVRMVAEYFRTGLKACIYQFCNDGEEMGLLDYSKNERAAFKGVKSLLNLLKEDNASFTPGSLDYTLTGTSITNVRHVLLQKSNGVFYLLLWNEVSGWNPDALTEITVPAVSATLSVTTPIKANSVYQIIDDGTMTETVGTNSQQISLSVLDRMMVIKLTPQTTGIGSSWESADQKASEHASFIHNSKQHSYFSVNGEYVPREHRQFGIGIVHVAGENFIVLNAKTRK